MGPAVEYPFGRGKVDLVEYRYFGNKKKRMEHKSRVSELKGEVGKKEAV